MAIKTMPAPRGGPRVFRFRRAKTVLAALKLRPADYRMETHDLRERSMFGSRIMKTMRALRGEVVDG